MMREMASESTILMFRQKAAETRNLYGFHTAEKGVSKMQITNHVMLHAAGHYEHIFSSSGCGFQQLLASAALSCLHGECMVNAGHLSKTDLES
jgi:hypothetical protein